MTYRDGGKRAVDIVVAVAAMIVLSPLLLLSWIAVRLSSDGPGFFMQDRLGRNREIFSIFKFRTMTNVRRDLSQTRNRDPDVTKVGTILRRTKIDELPQLINVIRGDMSIVGPRPWPLAVLDEVPEWAHRRFDVRPGLTGLSQVSGNINLSREERCRLDVQYVDGLSLKTDATLLLRTAGAIVKGED